IIKDRIYTCGTDSLPRRSAQTAIFHVAEAFVRWIAPILSFTAEEIWGFMPGERDATVFTAEWHSLPRLPADAALNQSEWEILRALKDDVNKMLEEERAAGKVKGGLQAEVAICAAQVLKELLDKLGDELRFITITSAAHVVLEEDQKRETGTSFVSGVRWIEVAASDKPKCVRCWHFRADVGSHGEHPDLCGRCVDNVEGRGEARRFA